MPVSLSFLKRHLVCADSADECDAAGRRPLAHAGSRTRGTKGEALEAGRRLARGQRRGESGTNKTGFEAVLRFSTTRTRRYRPPLKGTPGAKVRGARGALKDSWREPAALSVATAADKMSEDV